MGAEESGAAKYGFRRRDAARPARAAWAVQRLLAARWCRRRRRRRRFHFSDIPVRGGGDGDGATYGVSFATTRSQQLAWGLYVVLSLLKFRLVRSRSLSLGAWVPKNLARRSMAFGGAMLLDLLGPPGRCSGCWPHDGAVAGGAVADFILVIFRFGAVAMVTARPTGSASPRPDRNSWLGGPISAEAAFNDIAPSIQYVQLTSAIAQQAEQRSVALPGQARKAPSPRTRRRAYGILRSAGSSAFRNGAESPYLVTGDQLKLKRLFDLHNTAFSKIPRVCHPRHTLNAPYSADRCLLCQHSHRPALGLALSLP